MQIYDATVQKRAGYDETGNRGWVLDYRVGAVRCMTNNDEDLYNLGI